jgi:hypothetical protein
VSRLRRERKHATSDHEPKQGCGFHWTGESPLLKREHGQTSQSEGGGIEETPPRASTEEHGHGVDAGGTAKTLPNSRASNRCETKHFREVDWR